MMGYSGLVYPKGTGKTTMYQSGFIWGAIVQSDSTIRVGGSMYSSGLQTWKNFEFRITMGTINIGRYKCRQC